LRVPRFVSPSAFDVESLPGDERVYYDKFLSLYESYFRRRATFDRTNTAAFWAGRAPATGRTLLRRLLTHALKVGYLGPALPSVDEVLAGLGKAGV
jgi:hypothetical protein